MLTGASATGSSEPQATSVLARHPGRDLVLRKLRYVRRFFPELEHSALRIGLTRRAAGLADPAGESLWFNPRQLALHTIAHELTHLLQGRRLVPGGERSCDLFALTRHPSLVDILPCYLELPEDLADRRGWLRPGAGRLLFELAQAAVEQRRGGLRRYIRWYEAEVSRRWRGGDRPASGARPARKRTSEAVDAPLEQLQLAVTGSALGR